MFGWFARKPQKLVPESLWTVSTCDEIVSVTDPEGTILFASLSELHAVIVATNDSGPWGADFWWILDGADGQMAAFPEGATGELELVQRLKSLPHFDFEKLGDAVRSTSNASFVVWKHRP